MAVRLAFVKAAKMVSLTVALQAASKACWKDVQQVVETVALKVESLAESKVASKAETKVALMAALLVASKACWTEFVLVA